MKMFLLRMFISSCLEWQGYPKGKAAKPGARRMHVSRFTPSEAAEKAPAAYVATMSCTCACCPRRGLVQIQRKE